MAETTETNLSPEMLKAQNFVASRLQNNNQHFPIPDIHPVLLNLLHKRGYDTREKLSDFFSTDLRKLPDMGKIKDLSKAAARILDAIKKEEKIAVFGDYDVDGTTSCALLYYFFKSVGVSINLIQPSRFVEGYGIHPSNVEAAHSKGIKVLITVDCGITACEAAGRASELGIDLIITDHHKDAREEMPKAYAVINPNRRDEDTSSPLKALAGVAVAFALALETKKQLEVSGQAVPSIYPLLQFVAIGTLCDLAYLNPMNIKLVRHGLKQMTEGQFHGIRAFFTPEERQLGKVLSEKCGFYIGPMINSKGRLEHPEKSLELLISENEEQARLCFNQLEISNRERKIIQSQVFEAARDQALKDISPEGPLVTFVYSPEWHEGVIGIVASKLVETFKVPALVFTNAEEEGVIKASARSAGELNIFEILQKLSGHFIRFGGHKAAAGLSMKKEMLPVVMQEMKKLLRQIPAVIRTETDSFDLEVNADQLTAKLAKDLEAIEPFGNGNERPVFRTLDLLLESYEIMKDTHVRWNFVTRPGAGATQRFRGVSFNYIGRFEVLHPEELVKASLNNLNRLQTEFELGINRWNGREFLQLQVKKLEIV